PELGQRAVAESDNPAAVRWHFTAASPRRQPGEEIGSIPALTGRRLRECARPASPRRKPGDKLRHERAQVPRDTLKVNVPQAVSNRNVLPAYLRRPGRTGIP